MRNLTTQLQCTRCDWQVPYLEWFCFRQPSSRSAGFSRSIFRLLSFAFFSFWEGSFACELVSGQVHSLCFPEYFPSVGPILVPWHTSLMPMLDDHQPLLLQIALSVEYPPSWRLRSPFPSRFAFYLYFPDIHAYIYFYRIISEMVCLNHTLTYNCI